VLGLQFKRRTLGLKRTWIFNKSRN